MTIKKMFKITTTSQKESKDSKRIAAMEDGNDSEQEKTEVTAFKKQQSKWQSILQTKTWTRQKHIQKWKIMLLLRTPDSQTRRVQKKNQGKNYAKTQKAVYIPIMVSKKMCWTFMIFCSCPSTSTLQPMCPSCQMSDQLIYSPLDTQNHFKQFPVKASSLAFTSVTPSFARKGR
jgi:hypothetical protein